MPKNWQVKTLSSRSRSMKSGVHASRTDDEFAKDVSEFDTLEQLREDIRANLLKMREEASKTRLRMQSTASLV